MKSEIKMEILRSLIYLTFVPLVFVLLFALVAFPAHRIWVFCVGTVTFQVILLKIVFGLVREMRHRLSSSGIDRSAVKVVQIFLVLFGLFVILVGLNQFGVYMGLTLELASIILLMVAILLGITCFSLALALARTTRMGHRNL